MKFLPFKSRFAASTTIFVVLLAGILAFVLLPSIKEISTINDSIFKERERLEKLYLRGQLQKKVRDHYEQIKNNSAFLDEIMLKESQELQYITSIEQLAATNNIRVTMNIGEPRAASPGNLSILPFSFELQGQWPNILRWIEAVEELPYYTNMESVSIRALDRSQDDTNITTAIVAINAQTYWIVP